MIGTGVLIAALIFAAAFVVGVTIIWVADHSNRGQR